MTVHLVTFATDDMSRSARLCIESAEANGIAYHGYYHPGNMRHCANMQEHWPVMDEMFCHARGCGYWFWKPLIIKTSMDVVNDGDILIYADAGIEFIAPVSHIIDRMDQDIFLFGNNWEHAHWCKRDVVEAVWPLPCERCQGTGEVEGYGGNNVYCGLCAGTGRKFMFGEEPWQRFGKQCQSSVIFFRVSDYTRKFVKEWLDWCLFEGGRLIDDSPCRFNHPEFREHRHDQAILTTMAYREGISLHYWPAVYNLGYPLPRGGFVYEKLACYANDDYPSPLFHHHRRRNHEWK